MEDKYYTPTIEEFHVGFEYEYLNVDEGFDDEWRNTRCQPTDLSSLYMHITRFKKKGIFHALTSGEIRVKYLDKADIESLGFGYTDEFLDSCIFYRETYRLIFDPENQGVVIDDGEDYENTPYQYFSGTIKNKSELKVLLKQLGIYGDSN